MAYLLHQIIDESAARRPDETALRYRQDALSYGTLARRVQDFAGGLRGLGTRTNDRVAVYLPKQFETVISLFGAAAADAVFVPVNPALKAGQVSHILRDSGARVLVTTAERADYLDEALQACPSLRHLVLLGDAAAGLPGSARIARHAWDDLPHVGATRTGQRIDADVAAILYTSGSTGHPKGVVLSHSNLLAGARSVSTYLGNTERDRLLAVLPFSFDYGLSQLTTALLVGASVMLMDYLLPRDVPRMVAKAGITGLAAVPSLWNQLARLPWPQAAVESLRYITNSGGAMPVTTTRALREALPRTRVFLMYGLTEAFRSSFLAPGEVDARPDSIGKAVPNASLSVVRPDGSECAPDEPGELVHRGALVALGYWNDKEQTAARFRPAPGQPPQLPNPEIAVWSGDRVRRDADGYLYFLGRTDEMIKTSGYRVSPVEVEEPMFKLAKVEQAVAFGVPHPDIGSAIVLLLQARPGTVDSATAARHCREHLPAYLVPAHIEVVEALPRNPNGKIDRKSLSREYAGLFAGKGD